jgi:hypothetical protein
VCQVVSPDVVKTSVLYLELNDALQKERLQVQALRADIPPLRETIQTLESRITQLLAEVEVCVCVVVSAVRSDVIRSVIRTLTLVVCGGAAAVGTGGDDDPSVSRQLGVRRASSEWKRRRPRPPPYSPRSRHCESEWWLSRCAVTVVVAALAVCCDHVSAHGCGRCVTGWRTGARA